MRKDPGNIFAKVDWILVGLFFLLMILGWVNLYSAAYNEAHPSMFDMSQEYGKQLMWMGICTVMGICILVIDSSFYIKFAYPIFGAVMFMLVAVLLFGAVKNGARSWFGVGSFGIQPSEFAKFATALALARYLSTPNIKMEDMNTRFMAACIIGAPAVLILLQPDAGTVLVFASFVLVLYREGLSGNILLLSLLAAIISILALVVSKSDMLVFGIEVSGQIVLAAVMVLLGGLAFLMIKTFVLPRHRAKSYITLVVTTLTCIVLIFGVNLAFKHGLQQHQKDRIEILLGLKVDSEKSYNVDMAMSAIGSGGWVGKGYQQGTLSNNKFKHVPMQSTDFIFCSIGEEWGFAGTASLILLFVAFLIRIIMVAERQRSMFTRIFGYSVACIFFFHLMINIGMAIGLAPVIGIPLPLFSYGGSSLIGFSFLFFIFIKLDSDRMEVLR